MVTVSLIEEFVYYRSGQFLFSYLHESRSVESENVTHNVFFGKLHGHGRGKMRGSLAQGIRMHSGLEMCAAEMMLTVQLQSCKENER